jgi:hypothetical protein
MAAMVTTAHTEQCHAQLLLIFALHALETQALASLLLFETIEPGRLCITQQEEWSNYHQGSEYILSH